MIMDKFHVLFSSNSFISTTGLQPVKNYLEIFFPKGLEFNTPLVSYYKDNTEGYYNFFITQKNAVFLPDWVSEIVQIFGNQHINITVLRSIQEWTFGFLNKFRILCEIRAAMWWWLMFNPYQQPFNTLRILTEWYLTALTGIFPIILGIDIGPTVAITALGVLLDLLNRLVFTMPYLPSEGEKFTIAELDQLENPALADIIGKLGEDVTVFRYLPSLWYKYPIPDSIREYWYTKKPEILEYFSKNYANLQIDFLPDRILHAQYLQEQIISQKISDNSIYAVNNLLKPENILTETTRLINDIIPIDLLSCDLFHFSNRLV